jgi:L-fuconolactonase
MVPDMIIDAHAHVWQPDSPQYPWDRQLTTPPTISAPLNMLLDAMQSAAVGRVVLIQHSCYGYDNRYILDCARQYPDKFCTVIKVDPLLPGAADELRRLANVHHVQGLRLQPARDPDSTWLRSPDTYPLWEAAEELGTIVGILNDPRQLPQVREMVERFPEVTVVIDHMGRLNVAEPPNGIRFQQLLDLARFPNVYVKVSGFYALSRQAFPYPDTVPYVQEIVQHFGRGRLMWATDFPLLLAKESYEQATSILRYQLPDLSDEDLALIMGKTALRLFHFGVAT